MNTVPRLHRAAGPMTLAEVSHWFLRRDAFEQTTRDTYGRTLAALIDELGADAGVPAVTTEQLEDDLFDKRWAGVAPTTYNRHRAALLSFFGWCIDRGWPLPTRWHTRIARRWPAAAGREQTEVRASARAAHLLDLHSRVAGRRPRGVPAVGGKGLVLGRHMRVDVVGAERSVVEALGRSAHPLQPPPDSQHGTSPQRRGQRVPCAATRVG